MRHCAENHRRAGRIAASLFAASLAAGWLFPVGEATAAREGNVYEQAWACSTLYSRSPIKVLNGDDRETATCLGEGKKGRTPMTRAEAWELCREQFDTTNQFLAWTSRGWHCRYYPR